MNEIQLDEKTRLTSDPHCWRLERPVKVKDKETGETTVKWSPFKYYSGVSQALKGYAAMSLRECEETSLESLCMAYERIADRIEGMFPGRA